MSLTPSSMVPLGTGAPDFSLINAVGDEVSLDYYSDKEVFVVMFICNHCPYVIHIREGLKDFARDYMKQDVGIVAINSNDADYDPSDGYEFMADEGYPFHYLYDETQEIARSYNAACTPDIFLYDAERKLRYRGQFDSSRPGNGIPVTGYDLRDAVDALLNKKEISEEQKPSSGCNIKWKI